MDKLSSRLLLMVAAMAFSVPSRAQPPIQFTNSTEAMRQYEESTIEGLRERCKLKRASASLEEREEVASIRNGFVSVRSDSRTPGWYELFAFDSDKRTFTLIEGQSLGRGAKLQVKLSLPRDYSRCRIVQNPAYTDQLEVVHLERNSPGEAQKMRALVQRTKELAQSTAANASNSNCLQFPAGSPAHGSDRFLVEGELVRLHACNTGLLDAHERMVRLSRKVFER